jgi:fluoroacetyl-CoA thioesterase
VTETPAPSTASTPNSATVDLDVTEADTARALGSGDLPVLGTPRLIALAEEATVAAASGKVGAGQSSVGTRVRFDHLRATPVGGKVTATAELVYEDGRLLRFSVVAHDADGRLIGEGEITRVVVDVERFLAKL